MFHNTGRFGAVEGEFPVLDADCNKSAGLNLSFEHQFGDRVFNPRGNRPAERPCAVHIVKSGLADLINCFRCDLQVNVKLLQPFFQRGEHSGRDFRDVRAGQLVEDDDIIDPV